MQTIPTHPPDDRSSGFRLVTQADGGFSVCWGNTPILEFSAPGTIASIPPGAEDQFAMVDLLRWGAPFALTQRGLTLLHAACAVGPHGALALMAPGGTGKTTTALALQRLGWELIAGDALLLDGAGHVDARAEFVLRDWCEQASASAKRIRTVDYATLINLLLQLQSSPERSAAALTAIAFVSLPRTLDGSIVARALTPMAAFHELVQHGFGSAPECSAWRLEARGYQALANRVRFWSTRVPEGAEPLERALSNGLDFLFA